MQTANDIEALRVANVRSRNVQKCVHRAVANHQCAVSPYNPCHPGVSVLYMLQSHHSQHLGEKETVTYNNSAYMRISEAWVTETQLGEMELGLQMIIF